MPEFLDQFSSAFINLFVNFVELLPTLLLSILSFVLFFFMASYVSQSFRIFLAKKIDDPLLLRFLGQSLKIVLLIIGFMLSLQILGLAGVAAGLLTGASVSALIIGFAFKDIGENFLSGIIMAFNRPFRIGDLVEIQGNKGKVMELNLRNSLIKTFDGRNIYIPNSLIVKNPLINYTIDGYRRYEIEIDLDIDSDTDKAIRICTEMLKSVSGVLEGEYAPSAYIIDIGPRKKLRAYYWLNTFDTKVNPLAVKSEAMSKIVELLDKHGLYLPGEIFEVKNFRNQSLSMQTQMPYGS